tara:strand:- start:1216 stop:1422 length:207 start_codon:yes stop_codon:yes gene_type:complete
MQVDTKKKSDTSSPYIGGESYKQLYNDVRFGQEYHRVTDVGQNRTQQILMSPIETYISQGTMYIKLFE